MFSPVQFWDKKILGWEKAKYSRSGSKLSMLPVSLKVDVNKSVKARLEFARRALLPLVRDRVVVELGCGSAILAPEILRAGARRYVGIDFSKTAIEAAQQRVTAMGVDSKAELLCQDVCGLEPLETDVCFSLGLTDWLDPLSLKKMLEKVRAELFFHSFSEKRRSLSQIAHRLYVAGAYGLKNPAYTPRYYSEVEIRGRFASAGLTSAEIFRSAELSFGSFIHSQGASFSGKFNPVEAHFSKAAAGYNRKTQGGVWSFMKHREFAAVHSLLQGKRFNEILDVGCGSGSYMPLLKNASSGSITLVDVSSEMLGSVSDQTVERCQADFETLDLRKKFDLIVCLGVLEFTVHPSLFVRRLALHLAPEGRLLLLFPVANSWNQFYKLYHAAHLIDIKLFSPSDVVTFAQDSGLKLLRQEFPLPINCLVELALA